MTTTTQLQTELVHAVISIFFLLLFFFLSSIYVLGTTSWKIGLDSMVLNLALRLQIILFMPALIHKNFLIENKLL